MGRGLLSTAKVARGAVFCAANAPEWLGRHYNGTDKLEHGYLPYYSTHFRSMRFRRMLVFEIGVGGYDNVAAGGSLQLWRDYLIRSTIIGLDVHHKNVQLGRRVRFDRADQNSQADLLDVVDRHGSPDIVIDDGSHVGDHIHTSFETLWPMLRPGGWYVVEDLATSFFPDFGGGDPPPPKSGVGLARTAVEAVVSHDPTFTQHPEFGPAPTLQRPDVTAVHCYPGIAFFRKAV
jgi:Methyltransferase domain